MWQRFSHGERVEVDIWAYIGECASFIPSKALPYTVVEMKEEIARSSTLFLKNEWGLGGVLVGVF